MCWIMEGARAAGPLCSGDGSGSFWGAASRLRFGTAGRREFRVRGPFAGDCHLVYRMRVFGFGPDDAPLTRWRRVLWFGSDAAFLPRGFAESRHGHSFLLACVCQHTERRWLFFLVFRRARRGTFRRKVLVKAQFSERGCVRIPAW